MLNLYLKIIINSYLVEHLHVHKKLYPVSDDTIYL